MISSRRVLLGFFQRYSTSATGSSSFIRPLLKYFSLSGAGNINNVNDANLTESGFNPRQDFFTRVVIIFLSS